jgi:hypothetical protein
MYFIWILIGMPFVSLLCVAFIAIRDGKVNPVNAAVHRAQSPSMPLSKAVNESDWGAEGATEVLIRILSDPSNDSFRVTIRKLSPEIHLNGSGQESKYLAKGDEETSAPYKSSVWSVKHCGSRS